MKKRIIIGVFTVLLVMLSVVFLLPVSRLYIGCKIQGTILVRVDGKDVKPTNVLCKNGKGEEEKIWISNKEKGIRIKNQAFQYNMYQYEFDVDTPEGVKHFIFHAFKPRTGGPKATFAYEVSIQELDGVWVAKILYVNSDTEGEVQQIPLKKVNDNILYLEV